MNLLLTQNQWDELANCIANSENTTNANYVISAINLEEDKENVAENIDDKIKITMSNLVEDSLITILACSDFNFDFFTDEIQEKITIRKQEIEEEKARLEAELKQKLEELNK